MSYLISGWCHRVQCYISFYFQVPVCVKELSLSSWNPPPGYRKLAGKKCFSLLIHGDGSSFVNSVFVTILLQQGCCQSCSDKLGTGVIFPSSCFKPVDNLG